MCIGVFIFVRERGRGGRVGDKNYLSFILHGRSYLKKKMFSLQQHCNRAKHLIRYVHII